MWESVDGDCEFIEGVECLCCFEGEGVVLRGGVGKMD